MSNATASTSTHSTHRVHKSRDRSDASPLTEHKYPPLHAKSPFVAADNRPESPDGVFRVVLVVSDSEDGGHVPALAAALTKDPAIAVQILATKEPQRFFDQRAVDEAVKQAWNLTSDAEHRWGVRIWTDADEWGGWTQPGDTVLHQELLKWADLIVVAPCSADMVAKLASGISEDITLSLLRARGDATPVIVCPSMNADMFTNLFTRYHLSVLRDILHFMILGPQDNKTSPRTSGRMCDWRDIVIAVQDTAALFHMRQQQKAMGVDPDVDMANAENTTETQGVPAVGNRTADDPPDLPTEFTLFKPIWGEASPMTSVGSIKEGHYWTTTLSPPLPRIRSEMERLEDHPAAQTAPIVFRPMPATPLEHWKWMSTGPYWERRWWGI